MINIVLLVLVLIIGAGAGYGFWRHDKLLVSRVDRLKDILCSRADATEKLVLDELEAARIARARVQNNIIDRLETRTDDVKKFLEDHKAELKDNADRLRAHAQQLHDEAQARHGARTVPTR